MKSYCVDNFPMMTIISSVFLIKITDRFILFIDLIVLKSNHLYFFKNL